jgi:YbbR domain-containing protein
VSEWFSVTPDMIQGARGVRAVAVNPRRVHVTLDREAEKLVPVMSRVTGQPLAGQVEAVTCEPAAVTLRGPQARLRTTESVSTAPVDVEGRVESFTRRAPVLAPGDDWVARITPADVQVRVAIAARGSEVAFPSVPVSALQPAGHGMTVTLEPGVVDVVLSGRSNDLAAITAADVRAFVDVVGLDAPGTGTVPVRVYAVRHGGLSASAVPAAVTATVGGP